MYEEGGSGLEDRNAEKMRRRESLYSTVGRLCDIGDAKVRNTAGYWMQWVVYLATASGSREARRERREDRGEDHREPLQRRFSRSIVAHSNIRTILS